MRSDSPGLEGLAALAAGLALFLLSFAAAAQVCPIGQAQCAGGTCANLATDVQNCGSCGAACGSGQICEAGICTGAAACPSGQSLCGGACRNLATDPQNCGSCGRTCAPGQTCAAGVCAGAATCPSGQSLCGGACDNLATDPQNCGSCGRTCAPGQTCAAGVCAAAATCPSGQTLCGGACSNLANDPQNCGSCGTVCGSGQACVAGVCAAGAGQPGVFACRFTSGALSGATLVPALTGPTDAPCADNFGSSGDPGPAGACVPLHQRAAGGTDHCPNGHRPGRPGGPAVHRQFRQHRRAGRQSVTGGGPRTGPAGPRPGITVTRPSLPLARGPTSPRQNADPNRKRRQPLRSFVAAEKPRAEPGREIVLRKRA